MVRHHFLFPGKKKRLGTRASRIPGRHGPFASTTLYGEPLLSGGTVSSVKGVDTGRDPAGRPGKGGIGEIGRFENARFRHFQSEI